MNLKSQSAGQQQQDFRGRQTEWTITLSFCAVQ